MLTAGRFDAVAEQFDETMKVALPPKRIGGVRKTVVHNVGPFEKPLRTQTAQMPGVDVVPVTCKFANAEMDVQVAYDQAGRISGLSVRSPGRGGSGTLPAAPR